MINVVGPAGRCCLISTSKISANMKLNSFNNLTLVDRALLISEFGQFLISMEYYDFRIYLFALNDSFVELYENVESKQIHQISMASYQDLDKYLSRIIIGQLKKY
jgi:hypothetical protein